ncbi:MAG: phosphatidate cytidylyltransferase [Dehalococcoidia bacterium]|nr:phosphatidate cytidylyltransferase [Dehalococcoidia bacterium]
MLLKRIVTSVVLLIVLAAVLLADGVFPAGAIATAIIAALGLREFYGMVSKCGRGQPLLWLGTVLTVLFVLEPLLDWTDGGILLSAVIVLPLIWIILLRRSRKDAFSSWAFTIAGVLYLGWLLSRYVALIGMEYGKEWVILALMITFTTDVCAFFSGRLLGRHKLAPSISPAKTWEGAVGGLMFATGMGVLLAWLLGLPLSVWQAALLAALTSVFAQTGDLVESLFKRNMGAKDSGRSLPGHGGILDRLDSVVFAGLVVYYYVIWMT